MVADMQGAIQPQFWSTYALVQMQQFTPRELEHCGRLTQPVVVRRGEQILSPHHVGRCLRADRAQTQKHLA